MLTVNLAESIQTINAFMQANSYDFPVLLDTNDAVAIQYGVSGIPVTFFIGRDGAIKYIKRGQFISLGELQNDLNKIA
jgi:peroxiredoxin